MQLSWSSKLRGLRRQESSYLAEGIKHLRLVGQTPRPQTVGSVHSRGLQALKVGGPHRATLFLRIHNLFFLPWLNSFVKNELNKQLSLEDNTSQVKTASHASQKHSMVMKKASGCDQ